MTQQAAPAGIGGGHPPITPHPWSLTVAEPAADLTETQKAYNVAQYEMFQLAAYGHCTYTSGELLTDEGKRRQSDYNDRIRKASEQLEAAVLRLVAEHAETFRGDWGVVAAWLRSLANDPAELSLLAVRPDEREDAGAPPSAAVPAPPPADRAAILTEAADAVFALDYDVMVGEEGDENLGSMREAWDLGTIHAEKLLRRLAAEAPPVCVECGHPQAVHREGDDPVTPGTCSACSDDDRHDYAPAAGVRQGGAQQ